MKINRLNQDTIATLPAGEHSDGLGLYLTVKPSGARSWLFKFTWAGTPKKMGLGSASVVTLQEARSLTLDAVKKINNDIDPRLDRPGSAIQVSSPTFLEYARLVRDIKIEGLAPKSVERWTRSVDTYAKPLHKLPIRSITRDDITACLEPIWMTIPASAKTFSQHLEAIFTHAQARNIYPDTLRNPADSKLLKVLMKAQPKAGTTRGNHKSLPYVEMPAFWSELVKHGTTSALTLHFLILTCVRTGEALQASWEQINFEEGSWKIPGPVMKNGLPADVPLSSDAIVLLRGIKASHEMLGWSTNKGLIFRGKDSRSAQSNNTLWTLMRRDLGRAETPHGFRSTFRTWGGNQKGIDRDVLEYCLHHIEGGAAEMAYNKADQWEKRQDVLQAWAGVVTGRTPITGRRRPPSHLTVVAA